MTIDIQSYRQRIRCNVQRIDEIFAGCLAEALTVFSAKGLEAYLDGAAAICGLGRGQELVLLFLEHMPGVARSAGEEIVPDVADTARMLSDTANAKAINPFLTTLPTAARRLKEAEPLREYFGLVTRVAREAPDGLLPLLQQIEHLLGQLTIGGLGNWIETGLKGYHSQPWRYGDYFSLQSPDSRAALSRERHGTLYVDHERRLGHYLRAFWELEIDCHPYSLAFDTLRRRVPHIARKGFHIPDVYDDLDGVRGIDRYRALLAHLAAHYAYTKPIIADNFSPW